MKNIFICLTVLLGMSATYAQDESHLMVRDALHDQRLETKYRHSDKILDQKLLVFPMGEDLCNSGGASSAACWNACVNEGYGSSTCSSRCGTSTSAGSAACWNKCANEGYSTTTCAVRCGTKTSGGSAACWNTCVNEGYGSSTCIARCGVDTSGGSAACWTKCTNEGYGSATCAVRCN